MNKKTRYTAEKALEKIWEIDSDLELNDSADSDDDDKIAPNPRNRDVDESVDDIYLQTDETEK